MSLVRSLYTVISRAFRRHGRAYLLFHIYYSILTVVLLAPFSGWALAGLLRVTGHTMVGNMDLLSFFITPAGVFWAIASLTAASVLSFLQHAGMMLITLYGAVDQPRGTLGVMWRLLRRLPRLLSLALVQVSAHVVLSLPGVLLIHALYHAYLGDFDIYFVVNEHPREVWHFGVAAVAPLCSTLFLNGWLYLRWFLALPIMILENRSSFAALRGSVERTRGIRTILAGAVLTMAIIVSAVPAMITFFAEQAGGMLLAMVPEVYPMQISLMATLVVVSLLLTTLLSFGAVSLNSLLTIAVYRRRSPHASIPPPVPHAPPQAGAFAWGVEAVIVMGALLQFSWAMFMVDVHEYPAVTAHRGSSAEAPENSRSAIDLALAQGADYVELDIRSTADGVPILLHDRDLLRIAGDPRPVWEVSMDEIAAMDGGSWFSPAFAKEPILTLNEALERICGRARPYLEIKPGPNKGALIRAVDSLLRKYSCHEETIIAALTPETLAKVNQKMPEVRTSLFVHSSIGSMDNLDADILAFRDALITPALVRRKKERGYEVHVWTVNDPRAMSRFIDHGVDNIITDYPARLVALRQEKEGLSEGERLLLRMRNWIW
ncbi:glycerophosphodiester phosphodiesterase family protein [Chitinivibrio alkaliphilus]|uniref:Glycerophosphoryl diester phosphodiesterase n=1 Tax=Chitinivibrio alkaliphilus ACht1 TaxID=1313304 RepID=U7D3N4_9BACT|nr:glycerophosphodiester phosphodiesterase family protein [Chitinivibrio alkaliphilus]ERP31114.1 glycerophosphoryl diester phosphodiesterase [Chitinivibrio alkaliphilus ACht1]